MFQIGVRAVVRRVFAPCRLLPLTDDFHGWQSNYICSHNTRFGGARAFFWKTFTRAARAYEPAAGRPSSAA